MLGGIYQPEFKDMEIDNIHLEIEPKLVKTCSQNPEEELDTIMIDTTTKFDEICLLCSEKLSNEMLSFDLVLLEYGCNHRFHQICVKQFVCEQENEMTQPIAFKCHQCEFKIPYEQLIELKRVFGQSEATAQNLVMIDEQSENINLQKEEQVQEQVVAEVKMDEMDIEVQMSEPEIKVNLEIQEEPKCLCQDIMVGEDREDFDFKDRLGNKFLSEEAVQHLRKFIVRCNLCADTHCSECQEKPYHLGYTCETYKKHIEERVCRFCQEKYQQNALISEHPVFDDVCKNCEDLTNQCCIKQHPNCNHKCYGSRNEIVCLPCLHPECVKADETKTLGIDGNSTCPVCYTETLSQGDSVQLNCKHLFHRKCIETILTNKQTDPRISFGYLDCPCCGIQMEGANSPAIIALLDEGKNLIKTIIDMSLQRAVIEGIDKDERLTNPEDRFYNDLQEYALYKLAFYECFKCKLPYFGGMRDCIQEAQQDTQHNKEDYMCGKCKALTHQYGLTNCDTHGEDYIEYKCQYCCELATWYCEGLARFCNPCHDHACDNEIFPCKGPKECPLNGNHEPNGNEYAIGCRLCRIEYIKKENIDEF
ncbi:myc binding protein 2 [Stylonychia lemnae]|uniref:Myc binding protein 2 n=1 Tax=Stylonychia lemnae TaxID=5949 RepID=A0A077ZVG3_STYLE|nr:myc binding protein 2 [Stylonychia lemnae]|eukprot:CDW73844.1 myc binding protein 2 [Stylonychia lemnae]